MLAKWYIWCLLMTWLHALPMDPLVEPNDQVAAEAIGRNEDVFEAPRPASPEATSLDQNPLAILRADEPVLEPVEAVAQEEEEAVLPAVIERNDPMVENEDSEDTIESDSLSEVSDNRSDNEILYLDFSDKDLHVFLARFPDVKKAIEKEIVYALETQDLKYLRKVLECPICLEPIRSDDTNLECGHLYHKSCFRRILEAPYNANRGPQRPCPICRIPIYPHDIEDYNPRGILAYFQPKAHPNFVRELLTLFYNKGWMQDADYYEKYGFQGQEISPVEEIQEPSRPRGKSCMESVVCMWRAFTGWFSTTFGRQQPAEEIQVPRLQIEMEARQDDRDNDSFQEESEVDEPMIESNEESSDESQEDDHLIAQPEAPRQMPPAPSYSLRPTPERLRRQRDMHHPAYYYDDDEMWDDVDFEQELQRYYYQGRAGRHRRRSSAFHRK